MIELANYRLENATCGQSHALYTVALTVNSRYVNSLSRGSFMIPKMTLELLAYFEAIWPQRFEKLSISRSAMSNNRVVPTCILTC